MEGVHFVPAILMVLLTALGQSSEHAQPVQPSVTLPPELQRVLTDYEKAWTGKDSEALARLFAEDGFVLPSGDPMVHGRGAIERYYRGAGGPLSLRSVAYATEGNVGYIIGAFRERPSVPDRGKFTLTLQRNDSGRWLIMSDMDNDNSRLALVR